MSDTAASSDTADFASSKDRALRLLTNRDHSEYEIVTKLMQTTDEKTAHDVADRLKQVGLIDDERFARAYAVELISRKYLNKNAAAAKLRQRGIGDDIAGKVLSEIDIEPVSRIIDILTSKFAHRDLTDEKQYRQTVNALMRMGWSYGDIKKALERMQNDV